MTLQAAQFTTARASQPGWYGWINRALGWLPSRRLDAQQWIARAEAAIGGTVDPSVVQACEALVASLEADASLSLLGRVGAASDTQRMLQTHLQVQAALQAGACVEASALPNPVYVLGWMRSGTTALHRMLAVDDASWAPMHHEALFPVAPAGADDRPARVEKVLADLARVSPHYQAIHRMAPNEAEECRNLFMHAMRTLQFSVQYRIPGYEAWLATQDPRVAYGHYIDQLRLLRHHRPTGTRMLLKDPMHLGHVDVLLERFPGAKFVFIHRDPVRVLSSMSSMYAYTRAIFSDRVDPTTIGPELFDASLLDAHAFALAQCDALPSGRVVHVRHADLREDPAGVAERIYGDLDLPWTPELGDAMASKIRDEPRHAHAHAPEAFGLEPASMRERLAGYCKRFDL
ncbi:MAG: sulfotransferase [Myxococcota bacterium]